MSDRTAVFLICGAGRSHTSHIANILHNAGINMGDDLMPAGPGNWEGHYEDLPAVALNDQILEHHGHSSWSLATGPVEVDDGRLLNAVVDYIGSRAGWPGSWGVKDPRLTMTMRYWLAAFRRHPQLEPIIVGMIRDTHTSAQSLSDRDGLTMVDATRITEHYQHALSVLATPSVTVHHREC